MNDHVLVMVGDDLADDVARCAAAAGYQVVTAEPDTCRRAWSDCLAVIVDARAAEDLAGLGWPRRAGVLVVGVGEVDPQLWRSALSLGAHDGYLLPEQEHDVVGALSRLRAPRSPAGAVVACLGGHGGAGASVLAAAVAMRAAGEFAGTTLLLDVDELGGGVDLLLGIEDISGLRWPDLTLESGHVFADSLHAALPRVGTDLAVLCPRRGDVRPVGIEAVTTVIEAGRENGDIVVVDLPRRATSLVDAVVESVDLVVVITSATVHGCAATREASARMAAHTERVGCVVRGPAPGGLSAQHIADAAGLPLIAGMRSERGLVAALESGALSPRPRSALSRTADRVLDRLTDAAGYVA
ncbi:septum site-determining protein Ssd [Williamsia phyllosphaerae]|uniref:ATPase AAA n=1 Tax=Williamsia phyllosphaerae TaxID=885042 RepID=A0ABQ1U6L2_9NOCA|nr:septum site-determining protein Ssd [Williamsia phyllosphaerae]GGF10695.1 ATPase AAA [Williamsia phyllosphaerae]